MTIGLCINMVASANTILHKEEFSREKNPWGSFGNKINELYEKGIDTKKDLDIPVYYEEELLFDIDSGFDLVRDAGFYAGSNSMPNESSAIIGIYPTDAIRLKDNGSAYTIYDTDGGYRLFLFFDKCNDYQTPIGFPIIVKNILSYSDFSVLRAGDSIEFVESIESVATLHKRYIKEVWKLEPKGAKMMAEYGFPCTGLYYLKEGLLKIEYEMLDDGKITIGNIELYRDYILPDILGNKVDYSILESDLPK